MGLATQILLTLGVLFLVGLVTDLIGRHSPLPRVTLLLLAGFLIGPSVLDVLPDFGQAWFPILTDIALVMIGFLLGQKMTPRALADYGRPVLWISVGEVLAAAGLVLVGLLLAGVRPEVALLLAGIAPASAPAATVDVVREVRARGRFADTLLGVVAVDDAWGLVIFSVLLAAAQALFGDGGGAAAVLGRGAWEVGGAFVVGVALGLPMAYLTGRIRPGEPTQAEALGFVLLCGGVANWLEVSYILAAMVMGAVVAACAARHTRPFHAIEGIEWPFMVLFFVLAGASLHAGALLEVGLIGLAYVALRTLGLVTGAWTAGRLAGTDPAVHRWIGPALLPQAGVALGMVLLAAQRFPEVKDIVQPVVIGATVLFELLGPIATREVLRRVGEEGRGR
ncbi:MAG: cation:proton antiporter [Gammaproteobacteria bacterium]|nr:cation:proton antiporter [Gammaproteobacteria bacterium]